MAPHLTVKAPNSKPAVIRKGRSQPLGGQKMVLMCWILQDLYAQSALFARYRIFQCMPPNLITAPCIPTLCFKRCFTVLWVLFGLFREGSWFKDRRRVFYQAFTGLYSIKSYKHENQRLDQVDVNDIAWDIDMFHLRHSTDSPSTKKSWEKQNKHWLQEPKVYR